VAGRDALVAQSGVGLTPTLAWTAPALGAPTHHFVTIYEDVGGTLTARAILVATGNSVRVPPRVLVPGSVYFAAIVAYDEPGFDLAAPLRVTSPRTMMPSYTALFTP
jgi:hypothetical protein